MTQSGTIIALSTGSLPSGVAVVRLSGPRVRAVLEDLCGPLPRPRELALRAVHSANGEILDRGLVVFFPGPESFTGEDCGELHLHGSRAVVAAVLDAVTSFEGVELAEAGAFTRRAFEAGKLDLTAVEGLSDLVAAETENQRRLAVARASGALREHIATWRETLLSLRAEIEAQLDFADEDDVPEELSGVFWTNLSALKDDLYRALSGLQGGRIMREGFRVVLAGAPNAGKSSLLNALTRSDIAIVTEEPGTTRDVRDVQIDIGGQLVILSDVAGLRATQSLAEAEGVRRARDAMAGADLVLWLIAPDTGDSEPVPRTSVPVVTIASKADLGAAAARTDMAVSARTGLGLEALFELLKDRTQTAVGSEPALISHRRDAEAIEAALELLGATAQPGGEGLELVAERLRAASVSLGRLTGDVEAEAVLDRLFSGFCIGK